MSSIASSLELMAGAKPPSSPTEVESPLLLRRLFKDEKISKEFLYVYVSGRFASEEDGKTPVYWEPIRVHCKSLRDLILYVISDEDLTKLGIDFDPIVNPSSTPSCETAP